jgi:hypothetical protein
LFKSLAILVLCAAAFVFPAGAQVIQPVVAIHDSELTRALETMPAVAPTPSGSGTTGKQWWPKDWHYFVMPEAAKEALRSDGTAFTVVSDSNISSGLLLSNGLPRFPILISLASEAMTDDEIAPLTNYVAAGGFLLIGSSSFTRTTNGTTRSDFAFANELGLHMVSNSLTNWTNNSYVTKQVDHRLIAHLPSGQLTWRIPSSSEEIPWGISPGHPYLAPHDIWQVQASDATVLALGDRYPFLTIKPYGNGYFIYCAAFQPLIGHSGFAPGMYAYVIMRRAIEWAFESSTLAIPKLSPWPYQYDAAFMIRHDLENFTNEIAAVEASAGVEFTNGAKGDYYFCTGTLRDDAAPTYNVNTLIAGLRRAVTNYGATIGPHNGGLKNPNNASLVRGQYDYWHWGPDEALDVTPAGYPSGKAYASASLSNAFRDVEGWLNGITNGVRSWVSCYFNATREDSYELQSQLGVKIIGDQKISPFPHWTLSTQTPGKRYGMLSEPVSDWFVGGLVAQSLEPWHPPGVQTSQTMHDAVDFYYNLGTLVNFYSHTLSTGMGDAGQLVPDYITYSLNTNLHPRLWSANGLLVYQWWQQRSNAQITATCSTNGSQAQTIISIAGATHTNTAVEVLTPATMSFCDVQVFTNNVLATPAVYRITGQIIRVQVGKTVTNVAISYYPLGAAGQVFSENFDGVGTPGLPAGWTSSASGGQSPWVTQSSVSDSAPNAAFIADATATGLSELLSPPVLLPPGTSQLTFRNNYDLEIGPLNNGFDGGVLEMKIGTNNFLDILAAGGSFASGGYTSIISTNYGNPLGGRFAWSGTSGSFVSTIVNLPSTASGQTVQFRWRCGTDNGTGYSGWRIDTVAVNSRACLCCTTSNAPPALPAQIDHTIDELTTLSVTNTASDPDLPGQSLVYALVNPPAGATIDTNGIITWTPGEAQGPSTNKITTIVTDSGFPQMSATNSFTVVVLEVNNPPVLPAQANRTVNELALMSINNSATDPDIPTVLTYTLASPPAGAAINGSGMITWTPTEAQGPGVYTFTTIVTDNGSPRLSDTNSFIVTVNEVNSRPVLPAQSNRTIPNSTTLTVTNTATDSDIPANSLTYTLAGPTSASISADGVITWTPAPDQEKSTNLFRTIVTDGGSPPLSATNNFTVVVNSDPVIVLDSSRLVAEGCSPTNNAVDPGETVQISFVFRNTGLGNTTNLVISLLATNGVAFPSAPQNYGIVLAGGGTATQTFAFTATGQCGSNINPVFQMQDGGLNLGAASTSMTLGAIVTVASQNFDSLTAPALPSGWTTSATGALSGWFTTNSLSDTAPNAAFSTDAAAVGLNELVSQPITLPSGPAQLTFRNRYDFENGAGTNGYDGGVLEISIGTNSFVDIIAAGGSFASGGYNSILDNTFQNPLGGRLAWSGSSGNNYLTTLVDLPAAAAGQIIQLRWRVGTDNGNGRPGWRIDSMAITSRGCCANSAPALAAQPDRTIAELTTLVVTNTAADDPAATLNYMLVNPPTGAAIDASGIITWTPSEAQGPSTNVITTVVTDSGSLGATNSFTVTVLEVNSTPALDPQPNLTINELTLVVVTNTATDFDVPANVLTYSLLNAPAGASIDANGVIGWIPSEAQGPSTNVITTVVTDNGTPHLSATNSFTVTVLEVNSAPALNPRPNLTINELTLLVVTNTATDFDVPANTLAYSLVNPPAGMAIATNGVITWTPSEAQGPSTNVITTVVTDNGTPLLSATNTFTVVVTEVNSAPVLPVQPNRTIVAGSTLTVTNAATDADLPPNALSYSLSAPPNGAAIDNFGVITWTPSTNQNVLANSTLTTIVTDDGFPALSATNSFTVTVRPCITAPIIRSLILSNGVVVLTWTSIGSYQYKVESSDTFPPTVWTPVGSPFTATSDTSLIIDAAPASDQRFYRVSLQP